MEETDQSFCFDILHHEHFLSQCINKSGILSLTPASPKALLNWARVSEAVETTEYNCCWRNTYDCKHSARKFLIRSFGDIVKRSTYCSNDLEYGLCGNVACLHSLLWTDYMVRAFLLGKKSVPFGSSIMQCRCQMTLSGIWRYIANLIASSCDRELRMLYPKLICPVRQLLPVNHRSFKI